MDFYKESCEGVLKELETTERGLSEVKAKELLQTHGRNELQEESKKPFYKKVFDQFADPMIIILLIAAVVSFFIGERVDPIIILTIVIINAALSIYQEGKAEEALDALKKMSSPTAKVIRDNATVEIDSSTLVPGDIIILETGDIVPADVRLLNSQNLKIDESSLTGESVAEEKHANEVYDEDLGLADRRNMAYSSTVVSYGRGTGVVVTTGENTEIGKIAGGLRHVEDEMTPLQVKLAGLSKTLGILVVVVCLVVLGVGIVYKHEFLEMFMTSIALAVAAIPEGLPAIVTIVLSIGMKRMATENAIVKKLLAVETLGTTTVICSDKTGTLTQNEMTVKKAFIGFKEYEVEGTGYDPVGELTVKDGAVNSEDKDMQMIGAIASLANDAKLVEREGKWDIIGDPTEGALITFAEKIGISHEDLREKAGRDKEIPFDSERKMMTTFHSDLGEKVYSFTKGAPDIVLDGCNKYLKEGQILDLTDEARSEILRINEDYAKDALRVLAFAYREYEAVPENPTTEEHEKDMVFVGLTGMIDPARPEAKAAIKECKEAGIVPIMITGDHKITALAIAKELGIATADDQAITGKELDQYSEEELKELVKTKRVFSRVSPENKVEIVTALKANGNIVAMTGDGVNDAPAIKKADIGVAMGITGTDVAKNTADMILMDDNFATIVNAVEEGRIIYANIKKFVAYLLSCNIAEVLIILFAILLNVPVPLEPIQLLWLNLVTDSFPAMALGVEKGDEDIMKQKPRDPNEKILDKKITVTLIVQSIAITAATLGVYLWGLKTYGDAGEGLQMARTMAFATLILAELLRSYSARSTGYTIFHLGVFSNKTLVQGTLLSFILLLVVMYVPFLEQLFDLVDLGVKNTIIVVVVAFIPLIIGEVQKLIRFGTDGKEGWDEFN